MKLIPVKQGDYWGYVDKTGKFIVNPQFKQAFAFKEGLALIKNTEGKYGYIDETGKIIINAVYKDAKSFSEGLAAVVKENQKIEFIDKMGKTILNLEAEIESVTEFSEGFAEVTVGGHNAYIDKTGKVVINGSFDYAYNFSEGLALIGQKVKDGDKETIKYGYIDKKGKIVINPQFDDANIFSEGRASVQVGKKYGFIDKEGKIIVTPQFDIVGYFKEGLASAKQGDLWGLIDKNGKFIINPQYKRVSNFNSEGLCAVFSTTNDKWGFIDKEGKIVIEPQFELVTDFYDGIALTEMNKKFGVVDLKGKFLTNPIYDDINLASSGTYLIQSDYFDIGFISGLIFKDLNSSSFHGITSDMDFKALQSKYSGLTHDNYSKFYSSIKESNIALDLNYIGFEFNSGFTSITTKYKTEQRYNYYTSRYENYQVYQGKRI
ncbi:MAG: WG repeat-containing protein [Bacteroidota bacterium]